MHFVYSRAPCSHKQFIPVYLNESVNTDTLAPLLASEFTCNFVLHCPEKTGHTVRIQNFLPSHSARSLVCRTAELSVWRQNHFLTRIHWTVLQTPDKTQEKCFNLVAGADNLKSKTLFKSESSCTKLSRLSILMIRKNSCVSRCPSSVLKPGPWFGWPSSQARTEFGKRNVA